MVYLATNNGLVMTEDWLVTGRVLEGKHVTAVIRRGDVLLAGTRDGVFRSEDGGQTWREATRGLETRLVRWMGDQPTGAARIAGAVFAGTEPAGVFVSQDGGETWRTCPEVATLRDRFQWFLPYSPLAGCVRGFAFHGSRAYAAVEVGGALRSDDGGETWNLTGGSDGQPKFGRPPERMVHPDVHSIYTHPASPDLVYAPTGGGFYRSTDGGATWRCDYDCYVRAAWIDPADPEHILLGPASGVDRDGRIEESRDGGASWQPASDGLDVPWSRHMVERFVPVGEDMIAVLSNGEVLTRPVAGGAWRRVLDEVEEVNAVCG